MTESNDEEFYKALDEIDFDSCLLSKNLENLNIITPPTTPSFEPKIETCSVHQPFVPDLYSTDTDLSFFLDEMTKNFSDPPANTNSEPRAHQPIEPDPNSADYTDDLSFYLDEMAKNFSDPPGNTNSEPCAHQPFGTDDPNSGDDTDLSLFLNEMAENLLGSSDPATSNDSVVENKPTSNDLSLDTTSSSDGLDQTRSECQWFEQLVKKTLMEDTEEQVTLLQPPKKKRRCDKRVKKPRKIQKTPPFLLPSPPKNLNQIVIPTDQFITCQLNPPQIPNYCLNQIVAPAQQLNVCTINPPQTSNFISNQIAIPTKEYTIGTLNPVVETNSDIKIFEAGDLFPDYKYILYVKT